MAIERAVKQAAARYSATVTGEGTECVVQVGEDVQLRMPGQRAILRIPIAQWGGFVSLITATERAVSEKAQVEAAQVELPWERTETGPGFVMHSDGVQPPDADAVAASLAVRRVSA